MEREYCEIVNRYVKLEENMGCVVYRPKEKAKRKSVGIVLMHSDADYYGFLPALELAKRGYTVVASKVRDANEILDEKILDVKTVMDFLGKFSYIKTRLLLGHSGGATLMSAYQAVAENGIQIFQDEKKIIRLSDIGKLPKADGILLLDSNWGNGVMTLLSLEPGITDEDSSRNLDTQYDLVNPRNGYDPQGSSYQKNFASIFQRGQEKRNKDLIEKALVRLRQIESGKGKFDDDEPFVIVGGTQPGPNNRLFPQDIRYLNHTIAKWPLLHGDGSIENTVIYSRRKGRPFENLVTNYNMSVKMTSVKSYLTNCAVRTQNFYYDESRIYGIDWDSCYCCTPGNVKWIKAPMLIMGMTGSYEFLAAEQIYENAASKEKEIAFVEGASHLFVPQKDDEQREGEFGDTVKTCFDYVTDWIEKKDF